MARKAKRYKPGDVLVFRQRAKYYWPPNTTVYTVIVIVDVHVDHNLKSKPTRYRYLLLERCGKHIVKRRFKKINHSTLRNKIKGKHWGEEIPKLEYVVLFGGFDKSIKWEMEREKQKMERHHRWYADHAIECQEKIEILNKALVHYTSVK